jgi:hypothetical protein
VVVRCRPFNGRGTHTKLREVILANSSQKSTAGHNALCR